MDKPRLQILTVSTRDGRKGPAVAAWFERVAQEHGQFEIQPIDLKAVNLPMMDEPQHPRLRHYHYEHTKAWSATIDAADAFVFVTPEYNYSTPPSLSNALDYLVHEWEYKPLGFVSYGGISGGVRSVQMTKLLVSALKMVAIPEAVALPFFAHYINAESGLFDPPEVQTKAGVAMLDELLKWTTALRTLRAH